MSKRTDDLAFRLTVAEGDVYNLKLVTLALSKRLLELEPEQPCPGARVPHHPRGNAYCVECRG